MTISLQFVGGFANAVNAPVTAVAGSYSAGCGLILCGGEYAGADTITAPAPWVQLAAYVNSKQITAWGLIGAGGDTIPSMNWATSQIPWAILLGFNGLDHGFASAFTPIDRTTNGTQNIVGPTTSQTPSAGGALIIIAAQKDKTSTSNGSVLSAPSGFTLAATQTLSGTKTAVAICYQIQGTAATIAANSTTVHGTVADGSAQNAQHTMFSILPAAASFSPYPPDLPEQFTTYTRTYPRY